MLKIMFNGKSASCKKDLLFISPAMPSLTGSGSAMRAGCLLESLADLFNIFLLVIPIYDGPIPVPCPMTECCVQVATILDDPDDDSKRSNKDRKLLEEAHRFIAAVDVDVVHVFRMIMSPVIDGWLRKSAEHRPLCILDMDEIDSRANLRIAELYAAGQDRANASRHETRAAQFAAQERDYLHLFDMVYIANGPEHRELVRRYRCSQVEVVPNVIRIPATAGPKEKEKGKDDVFNLLFVGTMDYYPNQDAVMFFCKDVLPILRERSHLPFRVNIVGAAPGPEVVALSDDPDICVTGRVGDLGPYYRSADLVIAPIRAGGGTRIKILEAFSYQRPVVSTSIGAEGLCVTHDQELLLADTAAEFAAGCLRLMEDRERCAVLVRNALAWVRENHTVSNVKGALDRALSTLMDTPQPGMEMTEDQLLPESQGVPYAAPEHFGGGEPVAAW